MKTEKMNTKVKMLIQEVDPKHHGNLDVLAGKVLLHYARNSISLENSVVSVLRYNQHEVRRSLQHGSKAVQRGF